MLSPIRETVRTTDKGRECWGGGLTMERAGGLRSQDWTSRKVGNFGSGGVRDCSNAGATDWLRALKGGEQVGSVPCLQQEPLAKE